MKELKRRRTESPSSINTFKQCNRKYYYQYIEKLPVYTNIHLLRGRIVHSALEEFFSLNSEIFGEYNYPSQVRYLMLSLFEKHWGESYKEIKDLGLEENRIQYYYEESKTMIELWANRFLKKLELESIGIGVNAAFQKLTPRTEEEYFSEDYGVKGYIDAIYEGDEIRLMDYKTSNKEFLSEEYKLQLGIYALLYNERHGVVPDKVGIDFLKFGELIINVDDNLLNLAKKEIKEIHSRVLSDDIKDYPKNVTKLCKWSSGQCDFFDVCFKNEKYPF